MVSAVAMVAMLLLAPPACSADTPAGRPADRITRPPPPPPATEEPPPSAQVASTVDVTASVPRVDAPSGMSPLCLKHPQHIHAWLYLVETDGSSRLSGVAFKKAQTPAVKAMLVAVATVQHMAQPRFTVYVIGC